MLKILTFTIPKGGVGKTLLQANVAVALARSGKKVVVFDADPSRAMETITGAKTGPMTLAQAIKKNLNISEALYRTGVDNLFLLPSGLGLESYFDLGPAKIAKKLEELNCDFLFIDIPFPMSESAFLALGLSHYLVMIMSADEFSLCVESGIDLARLSRHVFDCKPAGFVINRITTDKIADNIVSLVEKAFEAPCIVRIKEDPAVRKSYGGPNRKDAYLFFQLYPDSEFAAGIRQIASFISELPDGERKPFGVLENVMKQIKRS
ncbi:MAG: MinD/ParA family protein [Nitrososphaera sp.]|nr:MinD/ParA family protein [Nitrososphaera sp.]